MRVSLYCGGQGSRVGFSFLKPGNICASLCVFIRSLQRLCNRGIGLFLLVFGCFVCLQGPQLCTKLCLSLAKASLCVRSPYRLEPIVINSRIKDALAQLKTTRPEIKAVLMGTRRTDPHSSQYFVCVCVDKGGVINDSIQNAGSQWLLLTVFIQFSSQVLLDFPRHQKQFFTEAVD